MSVTSVPILELDIQDNAEQAAQGVLSLGTAMGKLADPSFSTALNTIADGLHRINQALGTMSTEFPHFTRFMSSFSELGQIDAGSLSKLEKVMTALGSMGDKMPNFQTGAIASLHAMHGFGQMMRELNNAPLGLPAPLNSGFSTGAINPLQALHGYGQMMRELNNAPLGLPAPLHGLITVTDSLDNVAEHAHTAAEEIHNMTGASGGGPMMGDLVDRTPVDRTAELRDNLNQAAGSAREMTNSFNNVRPGILSGLFRVAKMRMYRAIIMGIVKGIGEGVKNLYQWSKINTGSFAKTMDSAASSMLYFKNSIGAAAGPLLSALVPALNAVINVAVNAINVINQLFALLNGSSGWTKATAQATEFAKAAGGGGAGGAIKDLLADWDELNVIQSESGGGGGGGGSKVDYSNMFENTSFESWTKQVKPFIEWIRENTDSILSVAKSIGITMLEWRVATGLLSHIKDLSSTMGRIAAIAATAVVFAVTLKLVWDATSSFLTSGEWGDILSSGVYAGGGAALVGAILKKAFGLNVAYRGAGLVLGATAFIDLTLAWGDIVNKGLSKTNMITLVSGALKGALAGMFIGMSFGGVTGGIIGFITGLTVTAVIGVVGTLVAGEIHTEKLKDESFWGDLTLTKEEISKVASGLLKFPVTAQIDVIDAKLADVKTAQAKMDNAVNEIKRTYTTVAILADTSSQAIEGLKDSILGENGVIKAFEAKHKAELNQITTTITLIASKDSILDLKELFTDVKLANSISENTMKNLGSELAKLLSQGWTEELQGSKAKRVQELVQWITDIADAARQGQLLGEFQGKYDVLTKNLSLDSYIGVVSEYNKLVDEYRASLEDSYVTTLGSMQGSAAELKASLDVMIADGKGQTQEYKQAKEVYDNLILQIEAFRAKRDEYIDAAVDSVSKKGRTDLVQAFYDNVFGDERNINSMNSWFRSLIVNTSGSNVVSSVVDSLMQSIDGINDELINAVGNLMGFEGNTQQIFWKLLPEEIRSSLENAIFAAFMEGGTGEDSAKRKMSQAMSKFLGDQLGDLSLNGYEVSSELPFLDELRMQIVNSMFANALNDAEAGEFQMPLLMDAIRKAYESAKKKFGYKNESLEGVTGADLWDGLSADMQWKVYDMVKQAFTGSDALGDTPLDTFVSNLFSGMDLPLPDLDMTKVYDQLKEIDAKVPLVPDTTALDTVTKQLNSTTIKIPVQFIPSGSSSLTIPFPTIPHKADGGFVGNGQMFIARERGPELVGKIGSRNGVANNDQIVEGITNGVADGQQDTVNAINRLVNIAQYMATRNNEVVLRPSTALARTIKKSNEMLTKAGG